PWYETACKALVMQLLVQLLRVRPAARRYERYREAVLELMADIRGRSGDDWTVGSMASRINVHEDYFSKMFTDIAGVNPSKFVQQARHREAKRLLRDTDWKMDRIARRVGYADLHYFSRMFRKLEGIPVREYRKLAQRYRPV
ncbi:helix-turn-helix transcriptional regulator, partial [Paenibacillus sp.]|uniref:helix-turn-helix transcriptional regulator n=1 Tax=Paenibacillus sp. TaxID=58172 RepID=UPI002D6B700F